LLIHEVNLLSSTAELNVGWDEYYDSTSVAGYSFYGLAALGTADNANAWWIIASRLNTDGSVAKSRYYKPNQQWSNRDNLNLP